MALYTSSVTLRRDAALAVMQFALSQNYVASLVAPDMPMPDQGGTFKKATARSISQLASTKAGNKGGPNMDEAEFDQDTYFCDKHWYDIPLTDTEAAQLEQSFDVRVMHAKLSAQRVILREEYDLASTLFNTTTWPLSGTTGLSVSVPWATSATATPIDDVAFGQRTILAKTGVVPDTLLVTFKGLQDLSRAAQIIDRVKNVSTEVVNGVLRNSALAAALNVKRILVASAVYNSADMGQTMSGSSVWNTDNAMLFCSTPMQVNPETGMEEAAADAKVPQLCRTITWTGETGGIGLASYPVLDQLAERTLYRTKRFRHQKVLDSNFGFLFGNVD